MDSEGKQKKQAYARAQKKQKNISEQTITNWFDQYKPQRQVLEQYRNTSAVILGQISCIFSN